MKLPSVMSHNFSQVPNAEIQRSTFDRSHGHKTTFDFGLLIPIFVDEALPGDTFNLSMTSFARLSTPIVPVMDNMYVDYFFFAVPMRLLWTNWQKFNGEQTNPGDSTSFLTPQIVAPAVTGFVEASIYDFMGVPTEVPGLSINAFHLRAYNLIWNEWFRDQNLQNSVTKNMGDGPDAYTDYGILRRGKRHDYFTSCLPFLQKGTAVPLPLGTSAPVLRLSNAPAWSAYNENSNTLATNGALSLGGASLVRNAVPANVSFDPGTLGLYADLNAAVGGTINALRQAFQIQRLYERDARGGTRYTEIVKAHFGVTSPDARMQRPEYLGGGSSPININPIAQTSSTDATTPQGNLAAYATSSVSGVGFTKSFTEHCVIIGLCSGRADLTYQQGLNRMWSRRTRFDYYWPALSHIGEQSVLNKEIMAVGTLIPGSDDLVFGYQERYAEYRYKPSIVTGQFRSNANSGSLDIWHLATQFSAVPTLNSTFIQDNPPIDRIIAVPTEPHMIFDSYFKLKCTRPMPTFSVPGMIDHF